LAQQMVLPWATQLVWLKAMLLESRMVLLWVTWLAL